MGAERIDRWRQASEPSIRPELPAAEASAQPADGRDAATAAPAELPRDGVQGEAEAGRVDVRRDPLAVRDGCSPDRVPAGRWPSDDALVRSEQFAVNEAVRQLAGPLPDGPLPDGPLPDGPRLAGHGGLLAVHAPAGTGVAEVFGDLVAAIVTQRACRIADLPGPEAAFGRSHTSGTRTVAAPAGALTGFEIVLAAPESSAPTAHGLPRIGTRWRDRAARIDYFASTARLADGVGACAMLAARLGDAPANRAFAERWWHGTVRGTDVLFPAGESMAAALRRLTADRAAADWPAAVARFRSAAAKAGSLAAQRARVAAALTRLSALEQACEEASGAAEAGQVTLAGLTEREPSVRESVLAAEADRRARLAELGAHELDRPVLGAVTAQGKAALRTPAALSTAVSGGLRRGKNWRNWSLTRRELRTACAQAVRRRDAAVREAEALRAGLAAARETVASATAEVARLAAELGPLAETVAEARRRWGDHVPDGPAQAETEDAALIEWRETSAPWADAEYATARADVFLAALELHKALIAAQAEIFAANLGALMDRLRADSAGLAARSTANDTEPATDDTQPATEDSLALLAAWQSFFLVVPVVQVAFDSAGTLFAGTPVAGTPVAGTPVAGTPVAGTGRGSLGWLLAGGAERLLPPEAHGILGRFDRAVLAGDTSRDGGTALARDSAQTIAERAARYGTWLPGGPADQPAGDGRRWVGMPLRVVRGVDRATIDLRNDLAYDGLLISDRD